MARPKSNSYNAPSHQLALVISHIQWMEDELYYDFGVSVSTYLGSSLRSYINEVWEETPTIQNVIQLLKIREQKIKDLYDNVRNRELKNGKQTDTI